MTWHPARRLPDTRPQRELVFHLLSCAHCGSPAEWSNVQLGHPDVGYAVRCTGCGARSDGYRFKHEARAAWNSRFEALQLRAQKTLGDRLKGSEG
jgi:hypothetical protein